MHQMCLPHAAQIRQNYCGQNKAHCAAPQYHMLKFYHEHLPASPILRPEAEAERLPKISFLLPLQLLNLKIAAVSC